MKAAKEKDPSVSVESLHKQVDEMKNKIQLLGSQHKAHYELWHAEKNQNAEKIKHLKQAIKQKYSQLNNRENDAILLENAEVSSQLSRRNFDKTLESLPWKVMEARKKLDSLQHEVNQRQQQVEELSTAKFSKRKYNKSVKKIVGVSVKKNVSTLENQIHRIEISIMETELLRKKYLSIRNQLMSENVAFESTVAQAEGKISRQEKEVASLEKRFAEFMHLRSVINAKLTEKEKKLREIYQTQKSEMDQLRCQLESYKTKSERLERRIYQFKGDNRKMPSESGSDDAGSSHGRTKYSEDMFTQLRAATGVTENEDIMRRFLWQRNIKNILLKMKCMHETEKDELIKQKEEITANLKSHKFNKVKDLDEEDERFEAVQTELQKVNEDYERTKNTYEKLQREIKSILERADWLRDSLDKLPGSNNFNVAQILNSTPNK